MQARSAGEDLLAEVGDDVHEEISVLVSAVQKVQMLLPKADLKRSEVRNLANRV